jgi:phospholipase C
MLTFGRGHWLPSPVELIAVAALAAQTPCPAAADQPAGPLARVGHILVIYEENMSFDKLFGAVPPFDPEGWQKTASKQVDASGKPFAKLPPIYNTNTKPKSIDTRFPADLPNQPFVINKYLPLDAETGDLVHRFYQEQLQIDHGKMDRYALVSDAGGLTMAYYDMSSSYLVQLAKRGRVLDRMFHPAFGGSFLNHQWLICACTPTYSGTETPSPSPPSNTSSVDASGNPVVDKAYTPDGYAVNTVLSVYLHPPKEINPDQLLPPQQQRTIGDLLDAAKVPWAWYADGYSAAIAGTPDKLFQFHHQPFVYYAANAPDKPSSVASTVGTPATEAHRATHLKDYKDFLAALDAGKLEPVTWYKPIGENNEHPGYADIQTGDNHLKDLFENHIFKSPNWKDMLVIITYDEHGGAFDHVPPPSKPPLADRWGPGTRVPGLILSPFVTPGIDHTHYDQTAILKLIEHRFGLPPLGTRDAAQADLARNLSP